MGSVNTTLNSTSIQQSQVSQINQSCTQNVLANLSNVDITVISSTIGDITLTNSVQVGNLECVLNASSVNSISNMIDNVTKNVDSSLLPFQFSADFNTTVNTTDIASFQQAIINQTCNQTISAITTNASMTFIDAVTGNILIANKAEVSTSSCNLAASTYQQAVNAVTNDTANTKTCGCGSFDAIMCLPVLLGIIILPVLAKFGGGGAGGGFGQKQDQKDQADSKTFDQVIELEQLKKNQPLQTQSVTKNGGPNLYNR